MIKDKGVRRPEGNRSERTEQRKERGGRRGEIKSRRESIENEYRKK